VAKVSFTDGMRLASTLAAAAVAIVAVATAYALRTPAVRRPPPATSAS